VFLAKFCDFGSCRKFEAVIFGASPLLGVFIISPKFRLKAPSGLGDPSIESLELTRGHFFLGCPGSSNPEAVCSGRGPKVPTISSVESRAWSGSSELLVVCSGRLLQF
jgi:hypothetical protein